MPLQLLPAAAVIGAALLASPTADKADEAKLAELPPFEGIVTLAQGSSFNSYIPPQKGDTVRIDWADLTRPKDGKVFWLQFDMSPERKKRWESAGGGKSRPYIGVPGPFRVEKVHHFREDWDLVSGVRLVAADDRGWKVTLDLSVGGEAGDESPAGVWIILEHGAIQSVARLEGKIAGKLPAPWFTPPRARAAAAGKK